MLVLVESLSENIVVHTSPLPPVVVSTSQVGMDQVTLHLDPPAQLGPDTHIENFELKFSAMDENGTFPISNTEQSLYISPTNLQVTVPYLLPGVIYSFQSKVEFYCVRKTCNNEKVGRLSGRGEELGGEADWMEMGK